MPSWSELGNYNENIQPPPELPFHSFLPEQPGKQSHGRHIVNKLKAWFGTNKGEKRFQFEKDEEFYDDDVRDGMQGNGDDDNSKKKNIENDVDEHLNKQIYLVDEDPFMKIPEGNEEHLKDSAKTFMTSNNIDANNIPHFPREIKHDVDGSIQKEQVHLKMTPGYSNLLNKPISHILMDPASLPNLSSSIHAKNVTLRTVSKRLVAVANKKNEVSKLMQKFSKDLILWGQNSASENGDSITLATEIQQLFQLDLILEQKIAEKLKILTKELEYICTRQDQLATGKKNLWNALKRFEYSKNKKGEDDEETILLKEKVIAYEKSYEAYKCHYQYAISVTARQLFKDVGIEYYERSTDLKEATGNYLRTTLHNLEINNSQIFAKDFEKLKVLRAERNWSKLNSVEKSDPQSWADLVSGKYAGNDTLMKKICQGLPQAYTAIPKRLPESPKLNIQTGLEESISGVPTERFNPITSNRFFLERSSTPNTQFVPENCSPKISSYIEDNGIKDGIEPTEETRKVENIEAEKNQAVPVLTHDNISIHSKRISLRKNSNMSRPQKTLDKTNAAAQKKKNVNSFMKSDKENGFILNFGSISQQFNEAERNLEENRWIESP